MRVCKYTWRGFKIQIICLACHTLLGYLLLEKYELKLIDSVLSQNSGDSNFCSHFLSATFDLNPYCAQANLENVFFSITAQMINRYGDKIRNSFHGKVDPVIKCYKT